MLRGQEAIAFHNMKKKQKDSDFCLKSFPYSVAKSLSKWETFEFDLASLTYSLLPRKKGVSPPLLQLYALLLALQLCCRQNTKYIHMEHTPLNLI